MFCASVAYPITPDGTFDSEYFSQRHIPMFARLLGAACVRCEIHTNLESHGAPPPLHHAIAYLWVTSSEAFGAVLAEHGPEIYADIPNFTTIEPVRLWSEVEAISVQS